MVVFILLGVLFGTMIMTFIFGNMGTIDVIADSSGSVNNETGFYLNGTTYTVDQASLDGFGSFVVTQVINASSNETVGSGNYTTTSSGTITNVTAWGDEEVYVSYTYSYYSDAEINKRSVNNESLYSITRYTSQSDTQMLVIGIVITLLILIALFIVFWKYFMKDTISKMGSSDKAGNFG